MIHNTTIIRATLALGLLASGAFSAGAADGVSTVSLSVPELPVIRLSAKPEDNAWLAANATLPIAANYTVALAAKGTVTNVVQVAVEIGAGSEFTKLDYWLGDEIKAPSGLTVDASETYERWREKKTEGFVVDKDGRVFVTAGGVREFVWRIAKGEGVVEDYGIYYSLGTTSYGRPKRMFWTDPPFNGPVIDLTGTFPDFYGPASLVQGELGPITNHVGNVGSVVSSVVTGQVSGLCYTPSAQTLSVCGQNSGQFVLAYYDTGNHEHLLHVQAVEIRRPEVIVQKGVVGSRLEPDGGGYLNRDELTAQPSASVDEDVLGPFYYLHNTDTPSARHNGWLYSIRRTDSRRWSMETWWMEKDVMNVSWPFECDHYACSWPNVMPVHVRNEEGGQKGLPIWIPDAYQPTLQKYREPVLFDVALNDHKLETPGAGKSLVRLVQNDDVWFLPLDSVLRTNPAYYHTNSSVTWRVGTRIVPRLTGTTGLACSFDALGAKINAAVPGYVNQAVSDTTYDAAIYKERSSALWPKGVRELDSVIYPVNAPTGGSPSKPIEVWWSTSWSRDEMTVPIDIPALPQRYAPVWPREIEVPKIVLAGGAGNETESVWLRHGTLQFTDAMGSMALGPGTYCDDATGSTTIMFWTRKATPETANASALISLASEEGGGVFDSLDIRAKGDGKIELRLTKTWFATRQQTSPNGLAYTVGVLTNDSRAVTGAAAASNEWQHVAVSVADGIATLVVDGKESGALTMYPGFKELRSITSAGLGAHDGVPTAAGRQIAELSIWTDALSPDEISELSSWDFDDAVFGPALYYSFREGDLVPDETGEVRSRDLVLGYSSDCKNVELAEPGPPLNGIVTFPDLTATVYVQNDKLNPGYNPNEEHAFRTTAEDGRSSVIWALRCDLNEPDSSRPAVFVEYCEGSNQRMQMFYVVATNATYPAFCAAPIEVGQKMENLPPVTALERPWSFKTWWTGDRFVYRDRYAALWARSPGKGTLRLFYPNRADFWFPALDTQPAVGEDIPWLACLDGGAAARKTPLSGTPFPYAVSAVWPDPEKVAQLRLGQTLTKAEGSLPEVWNQKSVALVYPDPTEYSVNDTALLSDPTVWRTFPDVTNAKMAEWGFKAGQGGNLTARGSKRFFRGLPPMISDRFWFDTETETLTLAGRRDENADILYVNVLATNEIAELKAINKSAGWQKCIDDFVAAQALRSPVRPNSAQWVTPARTGATSELRIDATPADHYALSACGETNWVVLAFNDATNLVADGATVDLRVLRIVPKYDTGRAVTLTDPNDILSPKLSVFSTLTFGGRPENFDFEWRYAPPVDGSFSEDYKGYALATQGAGITSLLLGGEGTSLADLGNRYYVFRYRAKPGTPTYETMGEEWSAWSVPPALAEAWVQRCLNAVTPYTQRMTDLYNNAAESTVSMISQAGRAWAGDVALNQDNLSQIGLIELYQTLLNTAERMSLGLRTCNDEVAQQLLLAVERLNDLYGVLGDEAYSDALNPTIGFGSSFEAKTDTDAKYGTIDYSSAWSSLFCFDNQVQSLLDEELALLRGRSARTACLTAPNFNRLSWNFTKGVTAGEVAYAVNYAIGGHEASDTTASLTEAEAMAAYPQGHGDAYGHYLTALTFWYRLIRNPYFAWGAPSAGQMNVNKTTLRVDYAEEAKFAETALKLAKAAERTADLTARKAYRDEGGVALAGYIDADADNGFGFGEWAERGGYGAFVNYLAASAQVPEAENGGAATNDYADTSLARVDRSTVTALDELGDCVRKIQATADRLDAGVNPIGLSENAVPFDISSSGASDGSSTHFEQIRARAGTAVDNARRTLEYAQTQSNRLRLIANLEQGYADALEDEETAYTQELIALFGKPYAEDIGPTGTYPTGYVGPDLYNFMMMDLASYGLSATDDLKIVTNVVISTVGAQYVDKLNTYVFPYAKSTEVAATLNYEITACGLVAKNAKFAGTRPVSGEIQVALADYLVAFSKAKNANRSYDAAVEQTRQRLKVLKDYFDCSKDHYNVKANASSKAVMASIEQLETELSAQKIQNWMAVADTAMGNLIGIMCSEAANNGGITDKFSFSWWHYALAYAGTAAQLIADAVVCDRVNDRLNLACEKAKTTLREQETVTLTDLVDARDADYLNYYESLIDALDGVRSASAEALNASADVQATAARVSELVGQGNLLLEARKAARTRAVANISGLRYNDMLFRLLRNQALAKYDDAFALAQKYVYLAAKAYDYETCLLTADAKSGKNFLAGIVGSRSLGQFADGQPIVASEGDTGLAATLAQLDANWLVLKSQLGVNNPQQYEATWFSLRRELFRIAGGASGDEAWKTELRKHYVPNIRTLPEYVRHCLPAQTSDALAANEPALVFEFSSTIDFAKNFFGKDLSDANDHNFDSTYYATKIRKAGVWFENYNERRNGYAGDAKLSSTPNVYLIPVGEDRMRAPGQTDGGYLGWNVLDQVIPAPYAVGASQIASDEWYPFYANGDANGTDGATRRRRYPSFRAYFGAGNPSVEAIDMVRLVGRSVWNTRWLLIIPAGALGESRETALDVFINGTSGLSPVTDIKIGFATYSNSGN